MTTIHAGTKWLSFYVCNPSVHVRHIELFHKKIRRQQQQKKGINVLSIFIFLFSPVKIHDQPTYQTWYGSNLEVLCVNSSLMCIAKFNPLKIQKIEAFPVSCFWFLAIFRPIQKVLVVVKSWSRRLC